MTTFTGTAGVTTFQAIVLRKAIELYQKTGMKPNRAYTPTNMLRTAGRITGKTFKRGQYAQAIAALTEWVEKHGTTGS